MSIGSAHVKSPFRVRRRFAVHCGPGFLVSADQNEKLGVFGFKILAAVDGFSGCPIHWEVNISPCSDIAL